MAILKKPQEAPSLDESLAAATAGAEAALSVFRRAVEDLEQAAADAGGVAVEADETATYYSELSTAAEFTATEYREKAGRLRSLLGEGSVG